MKTINFPYIAMALGLLLLVLLTRGSQTGDEGSTALPLLTLLIINECAFILCLIGSYIGIKNVRVATFNNRQRILYAITTALCILLAIQFALIGIELWPL